MEQQFDSSQYATSATGDHSEEEHFSKVVKFDRYEIDLELTKSGRFLCINSIKVNKEFSKMIRSGTNTDVHDVEKYYREE